MKKYLVTLLHTCGEIESSFDTDSPNTALNKWLAYSIKSPSMANICCGSKDDCIKLYENFIRRRQEFYKDYWVRRGIKVNFYYLEKGCYEYLNGRRLSFMGNKEFYDSVPLFCYG